MATRRTSKRSTSKRSSSRKSTARASNPPARRSKGRRSRTSGTKKGGHRKTSRLAYEKRHGNPPGLLGNPMVQGALSGAAAYGVNALIDQVMANSTQDTKSMSKIAAIGAAGALLSTKMVAKGQYSDAGAAMLGVATYEAINYARIKAAQAGANGATQGLVYDPLGVPTVQGLVYDPMGATLNPNSTVSQYA